MTADREALVAEVAGTLSEHWNTSGSESWFVCRCGWKSGAYLTSAGVNTKTMFATHLADALADLLAAREQQARAEAVASLREEWTVRHSQGTHPGPFTEKSARAWISDDIKRDASRQSRAQGRQKLLRRMVSDWEEISLETEADA